MRQMAPFVLIFNPGVMNFFKLGKAASVLTGLLIITAGCKKQPDQNIDQNTAPVAEFTFSPEKGRPGTIFIFDASGCSDQEDDTSGLQVHWDWNNDSIWDTEFSPGKVLSHQFIENKEYTVVLEVKDSKGLINSISKIIPVSATIPVVVTGMVENLTSTTAEASAVVTDDGGSPVTMKGFCWSTSENPSLSDSKTEDGPGSGAYSAIITGLTMNNPCYVRAYAINNEGTGYGDPVIFTARYTPEGVVAYWNFENNANDRIGPHDPPPSGIVGITYTASRNAAAGKAATFDGDVSIIEIPDGDLLMNTNNFTLSFWVKTNSAGHTDASGNPAGQYVMGLAAFFGFHFEIAASYSCCNFVGRYDVGGTATTPEDLLFSGDGKSSDNGGWQGWPFCRDLTGSGGVAALLRDRWANVVVTFEASSRQGIMFINGEKMKVIDFNLWPEGDSKRKITGMRYAGIAPESVNQLAFGFNQSRAGTLWDTETWGGYDFPTSNHFKGQLDDVRIFHRTLTGEEVSLMYNSEK